MSTQIVFWASLSLVVYAYAVYPLVLRVLASRRTDRANPRFDTNHDDLPFLSIVIAAYREESVILSRLNNAVLLDYPADRFEILIGVDGDEDLTGELVAGFDDPRVRLVQYPQRRGKASVLNDTIPQAKGDIIVLSDANTMMDADALRQLIRHFDDPSVGGVCGQLVLTDPDTGRNVDGLYWRYENTLKQHEARLGALLGVNGAIYAIRRELFDPIPANTIIDDFLIGMRVHLKRQRLIYEPAARAREETAPNVSGEFHRRARIGAGGFQCLPWLLALLNPLRGYVAFCFFSHKVLRWFCPGFLIAALVANILLTTQPPYDVILVLHLVAYLAALIGFRMGEGGKRFRLLRLPAMFVSMNAALLVGFWRWLVREQRGTWKRTERTAAETSNEPAIADPTTV